MLLLDPGCSVLKRALCAAHVHRAPYTAASVHQGCLCATCIVLCRCVGQHSGGAGGRLVGRLCTPRWAASTRCTHHSALPQAASPLSVGCCESESALLAPLTHHSDHHIIRSVRKWDFGFGIKLLRIRVHQIGFLLPAEILSGDCQSDLGVIEGILVTGSNYFGWQ